jgi:hypothetical protein
MKTKFIVTLGIFVFLFALRVDAATTIQAKPTKTTFETSVIDISDVKGINKTKFDFKVDAITNPQNISYWKVRSYCDKEMNINITASSTNDCGKAVKLNSLKDNAFSTFFKNNSNEMKKFSFKLKAYDKNGKWLHTEKEAFRWK